MRVLLIEDDQIKSQDISDFIKNHFRVIDLTTKESYQSGIRELMTKSYDLLLLDMSIPTWDRSVDEPGGSFEKFGGYKILRESKRKKFIINTVLVTMFDDFGGNDSSVTLSDIDSKLHKEFDPHYLGYVFYNAREENWKDELTSYIDSIKEEE